MVYGMKIDTTKLIQARKYAKEQAGLLTTVQADGLGITNNVRHRLVEEGFWRRIVHGMYALSPDS